MKKITFREFLNLIHEGKQPNRLACYNVEWEWDSVDEEYYYRNYKNFNRVYTEDTTLEEVVSDIYTAKQLAEEEIIHLYDEILEDKEKEYISNIIKPFKKYVISIKKVPIDNQERIIIRYHDYLNTDEDIHGSSFGMGLPTFKQGTMYKGMECYKEYTVEELGL